jgi:hypothetical protein
MAHFLSQYAKVITMSQNNDNPKVVPAAGNASNRSPEDDQTGGDGLIDKNAEKYIKESANIEDMPDPKEDEEAIRQLKKEE